MPTPASPEVRRYRGAVIGAGGIARQSHLPALRDAPTVSARVDVVALVDSAPDVPPVDGIPLLSGREQLRRAGPIDFIDICTPTASHLELTLWGLERGYHVEATPSRPFEYPERLVTMFFTWAGRVRENRIRFIGDAGAIEWVGGELRLERGGKVERHDYSVELEKSAYHRWFARLFESFVAALDRDDPAAAAAPHLADIRRVAAVVEHAYQAAHTGSKVAIPDDA